MDWENLGMKFLRLALARGNAVPLKQLIRQVVTHEEQIAAIEAAYATMLEVEAFHLRRQMFLMDPDGKSYVCDKYSSWSHEEWVRWAGFDWEIVQKEWIRGFYWEETDTVYFYTGRNCSDLSDFRLQSTFFRNKFELMRQLGPPVRMRSKLAGGMIPGKPGTLWEPRKRYMDFCGIDS